MNDQEYLQLAQNAYSGSTDYFNNSIRPTIDSNIRQFQGVHPTASKYHADSYKSRSRLFRPKTRTAIRKNEAVAAEAFFSTEDVVSITPENDNNKLQMASAEVHKSLMQYRLKKTIPWFLTCIGAYQDAQTVGVAVSYQYWEYNKQKKIDRPCIKLLAVENVRIDPASNWADPINSSPYVIELIPMYVKDVQYRMENADPKTGEARWIKADEGTIMTAMNSYDDITRLVRERKRQDSKQQTTAINKFAIVWVHRNIIDVGGKDMVYYTLGTLHMLTKPVPIEDVYFHGKRPYVMGSCIIETHKIYPSGVAEITKDLQQEINEIANQRIDNVKFALNKRYLAKRGKQVDLRSLTRNVVGSVTMVQDMEDVKVMDTPDVTASSYQEQDRLNLDFDDMAGSFSNSSVQSNRRMNETVGGMEILNGNANQIEGYQLRTFTETWVEPVLRQLLDLEIHYETDEALLQLVAEQSEIFQKYGIDYIDDDLLMQELTLNVNVGIGATNTQAQLQNFSTGMKILRDILADGTLERFGLNIEEVIKEIFGKLGYKDGGRFFSTGEEPPELTAAKATIGQLQQELSQKVSPELVDAQIRRIDAEIVAMGIRDADIKAASVKKGVESTFAAMQAGEVIAAIPAVAPIADEIMKAAGYVAPAAADDPNFPQIDAPAPEISLNPIKDRQSGTEFLPGAAGDTTPLTPANPESGVEGANAGIETKEADSV